MKKLMNHQNAFDNIFDDDDDDEDNAGNSIMNIPFPWIRLLPEWSNLHMHVPTLQSTSIRPAYAQQELANRDRLPRNALNLSSPSSIRVAACESPCASVKENWESASPPQQENWKSKTPRPLISEHLVDIKHARGNLLHGDTYNSVFTILITNFVLLLYFDRSKPTSCGIQL